MTKRPSEPDIQSVIGYSFKDKSLLDAAITHSSYVNEHKAVGNERLEFLGDCVLNFIVGERLYLAQPSAREGTLSARRAALVSRAPLARIVDSLGLLRFLRVGAGVDKAAFSEKARSDMFEAIVGAVYLDAGMDEARHLLDRIFFDTVSPERDYKSALQELAASRGIAVTYTTEECDGGFISRVDVGGNVFEGVGKTKHASQVAAARAAASDIEK